MSPSRPVDESETNQNVYEIYNIKHSTPGAPAIGQPGDCVEECDFDTRQHPLRVECRQAEGDGIGQRDHDGDLHRCQRERQRRGVHRLGQEHPRRAA